MSYKPYFSHLLLILTRITAEGMGLDVTEQDSFERFEAEGKLPRTESKSNSAANADVRLASNPDSQRGDTSI